jgi:putative phosphoesterase
MSIAIVGDTHLPKGNRRMPEQALELLRASDLIVHTGDFTRLETLELFAELGPPLVAVAGNVDEPALAERLPETTSFTVGDDLRIALVHDAGPRKGRLARMRRRFPEADAVLFGHSHIPLLERADENDPRSFQIFNPGSPTERRRAPRHSMGIAEVSPRGDLELRHLWL